MDKFAERKKFTSCKLVAAAAVAMCLLGSAGFEANAAPAPQVVSAQKATLTISGTVKTPRESLSLAPTLWRKVPIVV